MKHELTLTLRPLLYTRTPQEQYNTVTPLLRMALQGFKYTMVAELTGEFNIHYHAIIEIEGTKQKNEILNKLRPLNKFLGRKTCQAVQYEESYETYIQKDLKKTFQIIIDPVVKDDYNIFKKNIFPQMEKGKAQRTKQGQEGTGWKEVSSGGGGIPCLGDIRTENPVRSGGDTRMSEDPLEFGIDFTEQRI